MTALLVAVLIEVPVVAVISVCLVHRMLDAHTAATGALVGRKARDLEYALSQAADRVGHAARTGLITRHGPARLKDQSSGPAR